MRDDILARFAQLIIDEVYKLFKAGVILVKDCHTKKPFVTDPQLFKKAVHALKISMRTMYSSMQVIINASDIMRNVMLAQYQYKTITKEASKMLETSRTQIISMIHYIKANCLRLCDIIKIIYIINRETIIEEDKFVAHFMAPEHKFMRKPLHDNMDIVMEDWATSDAYLRNIDNLTYAIQYVTQCLD